MADKSDDAVERHRPALARPQYGENGAALARLRRGMRDARPRTIDQTFCLAYRDYVIDAFNCDKPYSQFLMEQLAGTKPTASPPKR